MAADSTALIKSNCNMIFAGAVHISIWNYHELFTVIDKEFCVDKTET